MILEIGLYQLTSMECYKFEDEYAELKELKDSLLEILSSNVTL
jgi:DNA gyrase/topoisomerase IV subunit A